MLKRDQHFRSYSAWCEVQIDGKSETSIFSNRVLTNFSRFKTFFTTFQNLRPVHTMNYEQVLGNEALAATHRLLNSDPFPRFRIFLTICFDI